MEPVVVIEKPVQEEPKDEAGLPLEDRDAFTALFRRYYAPLVHYARGITGDAASAADVLQDVFVKLWEDRARITVEVSAQALLYTMVRNRALNANRRRRYIASDVDVADVLGRRGAAPEGEAALDADDLRRRLARWVEELPPRRREAFTLSRHHGLSHQEVADVMGVSARTVDTHILLALRELRTRLDAWNEQDRRLTEGQDEEGS